MDELIQKLRFSPFIFPPKDKYTLYALLYFICTMYTYFLMMRKYKVDKMKREKAVCASEEVK